MPTKSPTLAQPPLSLYVHLPWCVQKCPYCDFNSYSAGSTAPRSRYLEALMLDLAAEAEQADSREIVSVFLGGGTPSLFAPEEIRRLLDAVRRSLPLADDVEITMEANPGTVESGAPAGYREAGVNRLSLGAQSFSQASLDVLGRIHSVGDIARSFEAARAAGFDNINVDIMYALPGQSTDAAVSDLEQAFELGPEHLSWYQLTLEPNTVFHARPPADLPGQERTAAIQDAGEARLRERGFEQYEVSAWSRDDRHCRHNLNYWSFGDYLAVGAGAHGKLTTAGGVRRYSKPANPQAYMQRMESAEPDRETFEVLAPAELLFEFMLNALRLAEGFDESIFEARTGVSAECLARAAATARAKGMIERRDGGHWRPTTLGWRFLNDLQSEFLPR